MTWEKARVPVLDVLKWVCLALILVLVYRLSAQGRESQTEFSVMAETVTAAVDMTEVQEADNQMVKRLYGLDPGDYEGVLLYYPTTNMGAEELLLVKLSDVSQQDTVAAAMEARVASQMAVFEGYAPKQYDMLQRSVIERQGNYLLLVVAEDPEPVRQAFLGGL